MFCSFPSPFRLRPVTVSSPSTPRFVSFSNYFGILSVKVVVSTLMNFFQVKRRDGVPTVYIFPSPLHPSRTAVLSAVLFYRDFFFVIYARAFRNEGFFCAALLSFLFATTPLHFVDVLFFSGLRFSFREGVKS